MKLCIYEDAKWDSLYPLTMFRPAWEPGLDEEFPVEVSVVVEDRRGVLATVATVIGDAGSNIENVGIEERDGLTNNLLFRITVHNREHLARVMREVRKIPSVIRITRTKS